MREERRSTTQSKRSCEDGGRSLEESLGRRQNSIQHQSPGRQRSLYARGKEEFCAKPSWNVELNYSFLGSSSWPPPSTPFRVMSHCDVTWYFSPGEGNFFPENLNYFNHCDFEVQIYFYFNLIGKIFLNFHFSNDVFLKAVVKIYSTDSINLNFMKK